MPVFERIYEDTDDALGANTHLCEDLVDMETQFQLWRFRHMRTVHADHRLQARHRRIQSAWASSSRRWN